jgi:hypothetical protein
MTTEKENGSHAAQVDEAVEEAVGEAVVELVDTAAISTRREIWGIRNLSELLVIM